MFGILKPKYVGPSLKKLFAVAVACVATGIAGYSLGRNETPAALVAQTQQECKATHGNN